MPGLRDFLPALALVLATPAAAVEPSPRVPMRAPVSGEVVATLSREDGGFPFGFEAAAARAACLADPSVAPSHALGDILRLARRDRDAAYSDVLRLVRACLLRSGWRISFCGTAEAVGCPGRVEAGEGAGGLDEHH